MNVKEAKQKYHISSHAGIKSMFNAISQKGFSKPFDESSVEEIIKEYAERCARANGSQCNLFSENKKKPFRKIGKYNPNVPVLTFQPPRELKNQFIANCVEFGIDYGKILNRIFTESKWSTWNNKEWMENFLRGE